MKIKRIKLCFLAIVLAVLGLGFAQLFPDDPYYSSSNSWGQGYADLWGIKKIEADRAWDISQGEGVIVAVIDTGIDYNHPDLRNNIWINTREIPNNNIDDDNNGFIDDVRGWDCTTCAKSNQYGICLKTKLPDNDPMDGESHGSHISGTIAAEGNNAQGVIGVAPKAKIMAVKGLDDTAWGLDSDLANAVRYAVDNGASVLSNSWAGKGSRQLWTDVFHYAQSKGCVAVAAAGNNNEPVENYSPANIDTVIAVAASTQNDEKCDFSNYGPKIEVSAPGGGYVNELGTGSLDRYNILSTMPDNANFPRLYPTLKVSNGYWRMAGTSAATPHVSGVAALILAKYPLLSNENVRQLIQTSADDIGQPGKDDYFGYGRVNAYKALNPQAQVSISSPLANSFIKGAQEIRGSAWMSIGFQRYELSFAPKDHLQSTPLLINSSPTPIRDGLLGIWDTSGSSDGEYILTLKLIANDNTETQASINVIIDNINQPPAFKNLVNKAVVIGRPFEFKVEATDPDDPATPQGQLTYSATNLPATAQFNPQTQIFSWQPAEADKGIYQVSFTVRDNAHNITQELTLSTVYIQETAITNNSYEKHLPSIYADKIVWQDWRNDNGQATNADIYMYDLSTQQETRISADTANQLFPKIYADKIVWEDYRNGTSDIYMYDLSTQQETRITADSNKQVFPAIYANKIVWQDWRNDNGQATNADIYMYDLSTRQETHLIIDIHNQWSPAIYANKIVWDDYRHGASNIYMYDLSTDRETQITADTANQLFPKIYADKIVWEGAEIYTYDLSTRQETQVTFDPKPQYYPKIYADKIVWEDSRNGFFNVYRYRDTDIYMYDLSKQQEIRITNSAGTHRDPDIYEDKIVWELEDYDKGTSDFHMARVFYVPQITNATPTIISPGTGPSEALIIITGKDFGYQQADAQVQFSGAVAQVEKWSDTAIECRIVQGDTGASGLLKVITPGGESNRVNITFGIDNTPPTIPQVTDTGVYAASKTQLFASWTSSDPESGIAEYQYRITQDSAQGTVIRDWTSTGTNPLVTATGLNLTSGKAYYFSVKAKNKAGGIWSAVGSSDGISVLKLSDINGNARVDIFDAMFIAQYIVGVRQLTPEQLLAADVNSDGQVTIVDAQLIAQYIVGRIK